MLAALFWVSLFVIMLVIAMSFRQRVQDNKGLRAWYERVLKNRLDLLKKIAIYGTIVLWAAIWMVTRGEEKASIGSLLRDISNSWSKQETTGPPTAEKK